jgi:hypothetical protein
MTRSGWRNPNSSTEPLPAENRDDTEARPGHCRPPAVHTVNVTAQHPMTDQQGTPWPFSVYSIVPKRVSSLPAGTVLIRSHASRMSSRYRLTTPSQPPQ